MVKNFFFFLWKAEKQIGSSNPKREAASVRKGKKKLNKKIPRLILNKIIDQIIKHHDSNYIISGE